MRSGAAFFGRRAFSIQEVMIAVGILGIGLIMVAAVFPVAMDQHRENVQEAAAITLGHRAETLMHSKISDPTVFWPTGAALAWRNALGQPEIPWLPLPVANLVVDFGWTTPPSPITQAYENEIGDPCSGVDGLNNGYLFHGSDIVSDLRVPNSDAEAQTEPYRLTWNGFYRPQTSGQVQFAAAICRATRGATFARQDLSSDPFRNPTPILSPLYRLPTLWRVTVSYGGGGTRTLGNASGLPLALLCPPETKMVVTGWVPLVDCTLPPSPLPAVVPAGRVLTVASVHPYGSGDPLNNHSVEVKEDISDLPATDFDVWIFPPAMDKSGTISGKSPLIEWVMF